MLTRLVNKLIGYPLTFTHFSYKLTPFTANTIFLGHLKLIYKYIKTFKLYMKIGVGPTKIPFLPRAHPQALGHPSPSLMQPVGERLSNWLSDA